MTGLDPVMSMFLTNARAGVRNNGFVGLGRAGTPRFGRGIKILEIFVMPFHYVPSQLILAHRRFILIFPFLCGRCVYGTCGNIC